MLTGSGPDALGKLVLDEPGFVACTPHGAMKMLEAYGIDPKGKHAVIVGRSVIVGKPLALLLLRKNTQQSLFATAEHLILRKNVSGQTYCALR